MLNLVNQKNQCAVDNGVPADAGIAPATPRKSDKLGAVLVTTENSQSLADESPQFLSPVQFIQDRLHSEFSPQDQAADYVTKDLRPIGIVFAIVFSVTAWTLLIQFLF